MIAAILTLLPMQVAPEGTPVMAFFRAVERLPLLTPGHRELVESGVKKLETNGWRAAFDIATELEGLYGSFILQGAGGGIISIRPVGTEPTTIAKIDAASHRREMLTLLVLAGDFDALKAEISKTGTDLGLLAAFIQARTGDFSEAVETLKTAKASDAEGSWPAREAEAPELARLYQLAASGTMEDRIRLHETAMALPPGGALLPDPREAARPSSTIQREATLLLAELSRKEGNTGLARSYLTRLMKDREAGSTFYRRLAVSLHGRWQLAGSLKR